MNIFSKLGIFLILICLVVFINCTANREINANQTNSTETTGGGGKSSSNENKTEENATAKNEVNYAEKNKISPAKSGEIESIYTDLAAEKCKTTSSSEEEAWSVQECPGIGIYKLEVTEGDLRQSINVIATSGDKWELDFPANVSNAFSSFGDKAEWRVKKTGGKITPIALITRYNVNADSENPEKITSYLVVTKFENEFVCITDIIKPMANANEKARELADKSAGKPCLQAK